MIDYEREKRENWETRFREKVKEKKRIIGRVKISDLRERV